MKAKREKKIPQNVSDDVVRGFIRFVYSQSFRVRVKFCFAVLTKKQTVTF